MEPRFDRQRPTIFRRGTIIVRAILAGGTINLSQSGSIMRPSSPPPPHNTLGIVIGGARNAARARQARGQPSRRGEKAAFHSKQAG